MNQKKIGAFSLAMLSVSAIVSLRNFPFTAQYGLSAVVYLLVAAVIFYIPTASVTAELTTMFPQAGGSYIWVSRALGKRMGFITLWSAWLGTITWFPTVLIFSASVLSYLLEPIFPGVRGNSLVSLFFIIGAFWLSTLINLRGIRISSIFSSIGVTIGTILPSILIILLGLYWLYLGKPIPNPFGLVDLIPNPTIDNFSIFSAVLLGLAGAELISFHAKDTENPQTSYPFAMWLSSIMIISIYILGTLALIVVLPIDDIAIADGVVQAFDSFFTTLGFPKVALLIAFLLFIGSIANLNAWTIGPAKGLLVTAEDGFIPEIFNKVNKENVPWVLLFTQAIIGCILSTIFFAFIENNDEFMWLFTALSFQFLALQYILIFLSALILRIKSPELPRPYKDKYLWFTCTVGLLACASAFLILYLPPIQIIKGSIFWYNFSLIGAFAILLLPALVLREKN